MDKRFSSNNTCFRSFGEKIKVISGLSYDIRKTLTDNVLSYQDILRSSVDDLAPDDFEFEYGRYSSENNIDLLIARDNTARIIRDQALQKPDPSPIVDDTNQTNVS